MVVNIENDWKKMEEINLDTSLDILLSTAESGPSFFQSSCTGPIPAFREITNEERSVVIEEEVQKDVTTWTADLTGMPFLTQEDIDKYFVIGNSLDNKPRGAMKHKILGYQLFKEEYVKTIKVKPHVKAEKISFLVKGFVVASMKKDKYTVYTHLCESSGDILYGKCNCKAGAGGCCKHVAAILYQLVEYRQLNLRSVPDDKSCTDVLQKWHVPGEGENIEPIKFSELTFEKADIDKDNKNCRKRPLVCGKREFCATPIFAHAPQEEKIRKLSNDLFLLGQGVVFANVLKGNNYKPVSFYNTSISDFYKEKPQEELRPAVTAMFDKVASHPTVMHNLTSDQKSFVMAHLHVTPSNVKIIEAETIRQASSTAWFTERRKRLTASNFGSVVNRRKNIYPKAILQKVKNKNKFTSTSEACKWGKDNENVAIKLYEEKFGQNVNTCGLVINPKWPWLGASPDGVMKVDEIVKAVEVKCPFTKRDMSITEACQDKNFFLTIVNDKPKLKENHIYFHQCQGVMAITETEEIDLIVYTKNDIHVETISFMKNNWEQKILPELTNFYFYFMKENIFTS